jgi:hypothetical protein
MTGIARKEQIGNLDFIVPPEGLPAALAATLKTC